MTSVNRKLQETAKLLEIEKKHDLSLFKEKIAGESFKDQRRRGVLWFPVKVFETRFDAGERLIVKVQRHKEHLQAHSFQSGQLVNIFVAEKENLSENLSITGVVNSVADLEMIITINADEMPQWFDLDKIGVRQMFDDYTYREMEKALQYLIDSGEKRINQLKEIILCEKEAFFEHNYLIENHLLNTMQNKALNLVDAAKDIAIIHGPPGTGKTTTLINAVLHTLKKEKQVLVCAPSNAAVDLLVEKLVEKGSNVIRVGHPARIEDRILNRTIDYLISQHSDFAVLKKLKRELKNLQENAAKYKRNFGKEQREQRNEWYKQAKNVRDEINHLQFFITNSILNSAEVIATTLVGANHIYLRGKKFSTVFIDEASQGIEPATWIPIIKANRVIFAGDHHQLPPTIKSPEAAKNGLEISLFEKAIKKIIMQKLCSKSNIV